MEIRDESLDRHEVYIVVCEYETTLESIPCVHANETWAIMSGVVKSSMGSKISGFEDQSARAPWLGI